MKTEIHAPWRVNRQLKTLINKKVEKWFSISDSILHVDAFLKEKGHATPHDKVVEFKVQVPGKILFADSFSDTHVKAAALAAEKIKMQLIKRKEKNEQRLK